MSNPIKKFIADLFVTSGGTANQYVKGDGTLGPISGLTGSTSVGGITNRIAKFTGTTTLTSSVSLTELPSGYVGIGTNNPTALLHVNNTTDGAYLRVQGINDGDNFGAIELWNGDGSSKWQFAHKSIAGQIKDFSFSHWDGSSWKFPFQLTNAGNTLINSSIDNLVDTLQVNGSLIANTIKKSGGTSGQYLMADGSVSTGTSTDITGIVAGGELSGTYPNPSLTNTAVINKVLTGFNAVGSGITATDTILQAFGKLQSQTNGLIGGVRYLGLWNASTNTPTLSDGSGSQGDLYIVSVSGTTSLDGISTWAVGDRVYRNATVWTKPPASTDLVTSVNGYIGTVTLASSDIAENSATNRWYTPARESVKVSTTTTISTTSPLQGGGDLSTNRTFSILQANASQNGYLSSVDWQMFNNKAPSSGSGSYIQNQGISAQTANMWISGLVLANQLKTNDLTIVGNQINETLSDNDTAEVAVNYVGYNNGITRARTFTVYNGKNTPLFTVNGGSQQTIVNTTFTVNSDIFTAVNNGIWFKGTGNYTGGGVTGRNGGNDVGIFAGGIEYLRVLNNGNVGIGTNNPQSKLHIQDGLGGEQLIFSRGTGQIRIVQENNADSIAFYNNDATIPYLSFKQGGNVGIGTVNPTGRLHVLGSTNISNIGNTNPVIGGLTGGFNVSAGGTLDSYGLQTGAYATGTYWFQSGTNAGSAIPYPIALNPIGANVLIGTSVDAGGRLQVSGALGGTIGGGGSAIKMTNTDTGNYASIGGGIVGVTNSGMDFSIDGARAMVIAGGTGNVGVGIPNPNDKLQVVGNLGIGRSEDVNTPYNILFRSNITDTGGNLGRISFFNFQWDSFVKASINAVCDGALNNGALVFNTSIGGSDATEKMRIKNNGNVLIGTTSDNGVDRLQVNGSIYSNSSVKSFDFRTTSAGYISYDGDNLGTGTLSVRNSTAGTVMHFTTNGDVGVGTTGPSRRLDVVGTGRFVGDLTIGNDGVAGERFIAFNRSNSIPANIQGVLAGTGVHAISMQRDGGNLLVGTSTDNGVDRLQVAGNVNVVGNIKSASEIYSQNGFWFRPNGVDRALLRAEVGSGDLKLYQYDAGASYLRDTLTIPNATGNVLIGTTGDNGNKLRVGGSIYSEGNITTLGYVNTNEIILPANSIRSFFINGPAPAFGNCRKFIRIVSNTNATFVSGKIKISGDWYYSPVMGVLELETGVYAAGGSGAINSGGSRIVSETSSAGLNFRISDLTVVGGYIGFYIYEIDTNNVYLQFDGSIAGDTPIWDINQPWESFAFPARRGIEIQDKLTVGGNVKALNYKFVDYSTGPAGVVTTQSQFQGEIGNFAYGISTNAIGGWDYMANQAAAGESHRFWGGSDNASPKLLMKLLGNGNVGIGTPNPSQKLDVNGNIIASAVYTEVLGASSNGSNNVRLTTSTGGASALVFDTALTERMRINANGNVMIGTTSDNGNKLQVNGRGYFGGGILAGSGIAVEANGAINDPYGAISVTNPGNGNNYSYYGLTRAGNIGAGIGLTSGNQMWFGTANYNSGAATATLASSFLTMDSASAAFSGNLIVRSPSTKGGFIQTRYDDNNPTWWTIENQLDGANSTASLLLATAGNTWAIEHGSAIRNGNALEFVLDPQGGRSTKLKLTNTGNLLINTTTDNGVDKLQVNGSIKATGSVTASSDERIKTNIRPLENSLQKVMNISGFKFDRLDNNDKNQIGFIAQNLEKEFPELVHTDNTEEGLKSVNYQNMTAVLVECIKEQQKQIDNQQKQIDELLNILKNK